MTGGVCSDGFQAVDGASALQSPDASADFLEGGFEVFVYDFEIHTECKVNPVVFGVLPLFRSVSAKLINVFCIAVFFPYYCRLKF